MAYKFQKGAADLSGSITGSGDVVVEGALHAAGVIYGDGSGITNVSSDTVDTTTTTTNATYYVPFVDHSTGADGETLAIHSALSLNPSTGLFTIAGSAPKLAIGSAELAESELEMLDGITAGTVAASKAVVVDSNKDLAGLRKLDMSGALSSSAAASFVGAVDVVGAMASSGSITAGTSFIIGDADLNETDLEKLDGITDGTVAANKAVVVDANKDADGFRNISGSAYLEFGSASFGTSVTAGTSFIIGSADLNETDLEKLDGITDGAGAANKALVLDASADVASGLRSVTGSGDLKFANAHLSANLYAVSLSGSSTLEIVGNSVLGGMLNVTGASDFLGEIAANGGIDVNGGNFTADTDGAVTMTSLSVQTGDIGTFANISGSGTAQFGGNAVLGGTLNVSGAVQMESGNSLSFNGSTNTAKITNNGSNLNVNAPGDVVFNAGGGNVTPSSAGGASLGSAALEWQDLFLNDGAVINFGADQDVTLTHVADNGILLNGAMGLAFRDGDLFINSSADGQLNIEADTEVNIAATTLAINAVADVSTGIYNRGYAQSEVSVLTAAAELTASSDTMYQIVSGGVGNLTVILPSASEGQNFQYALKRHSNMSGNVIIEGGGSELVDGNASITLETAGASVFLISDGTQWNIF